MSVPYISWIGHGAASLAPAGVFTGVTGHAFTFRADQSAMQALVDRFLNGPAQGKLDYRVLGRRAMASFMDYEKCTSSIDAIGWVPGRECALWVPLLELGAHSLRLVMWSPYIYIDYDIGLLTGREVWGWSKVSARIALPGDAPGGPPAFTCSTTTFTPMAPGTRGVFGPLFAVTSSAPMRAPVAAFTEPGESFKQFLGHLLQESDAAPESLRFDLQAHAVALKQVRDSLDPTVACYQAVCDSPLSISRFGGFGLLDASQFKLEITNCDSHRIAQDFLGHPPTGAKTVLPIEAAMWAEVDFQALPGRVIAP